MIKFTNITTKETYKHCRNRYNVLRNDKEAFAYKEGLYIYTITEYGGGYRLTCGEYGHSEDLYAVDFTCVGDEVSITKGYNRIGGKYKTEQADRFLNKYRMVCCEAHSHIKYGNALKKEGKGYVFE